jgi:hypothetical protein
MAKTIGGISIDRWKMAFAEAVDIAIDKDYFSDILFFDLYPNTHEEAAAVSEENEELADEVYNTKWECVNEAFKEVFGISRNELYNK